MFRVAHKIKTYREMRNYSQEYLASMIGISQPAYAKIEQGKTKITLERLKQISEILMVEHLHLLDEVKVAIQTIQINNTSPSDFVEVLHPDLKIVYEKLVMTLENENRRLIEENERLKILLEQKSGRY
ncbi:helix-turn-helix domain-containing protein [Aequorivita sp. H23M31]|uniref:Helix-turn-helix domain-containing protein n=1 Tax=Aequorivita ciconiae TaxID=2494375 RepID=A0A410G3W4_9FLAO|nr:helix-turn-helix transcriptional regulator [Aequorivita sp. H23M31]QAA81978.1 helix-turn-helix domain-containing protein [Aequorivita sp. H23M31]